MGNKNLSLFSLQIISDPTEMSTQICTTLYHNRLVVIYRLVEHENRCCQTRLQDIKRKNSILTQVFDHQKEGLQWKHRHACRVHKFSFGANTVHLQRARSSHDALMIRIIPTEFDFKYFFLSLPKTTAVVIMEEKTFEEYKTQEINIITSSFVISYITSFKLNTA